MFEAKNKRTLYDPLLYVKSVLAGLTLKMISVLRKERKWKLVDVYYDRFFGDYVNTRVILSRLKVMWDKGCKQKAFDLISTVNRLIKMDEERLLEVDIRVVLV